MEILFHSHGNKTHFHKKGSAPSVILKVRVFGTRKWPIVLDLLIIIYFVSKNCNWVALSSIMLQYSSPKRRTVCFQLTVAHTHNIKCIFMQSMKVLSKDRSPVWNCHLLTTNGKFYWNHVTSVSATTTTEAQSDAHKIVISLPFSRDSRFCSRRSSNISLLRLTLQREVFV